MYVFVRDGATWSQQAYIKGSNNFDDDRFGTAVAISGDTLVVGAPRDDSDSISINGSSNNNADEAGAAYVFRRTGTLWFEDAYLKASNTNAGDLFGTTVAVDGDTIAVAAPGEASNATGVNGTELDNSAAAAGAVYVFVKVGSTWQRQAYIKATNTDAGDEFGAALAISGDTLAVGAEAEASSGTGTTGDPSNNSATFAGAAYVYVRADGSWAPQAYIKASNTASNDRFGFSVSLASDSLAVGALLEDSAALGIDGDQTSDAATFSGAVYVFVRAGSAWSQQAYIKASNTGSQVRFGGRVALVGDLLAVAALDEASAATGVDGDQSDNSASESGAVYLFARRGATWTQHSYLKASNTFQNLAFGSGLAIGPDAIVVGATGDASSATGINGDDSNRGTLGAGAAYVFE